MSASLAHDAHFREGAYVEGHRTAPEYETANVARFDGSRSGVVSFEARYPGVCAGCDSKITPGQEVAYDVDDLLEHVDCPDTYSSTVAGVCDECFQARALNGTCGCY